MLAMLIILFVVLLVIGVGTYFAPMAEPMKKIIYAAAGCVAFIVILVFALNAFGLLHAGMGVGLGEPVYSSHHR